MPCLAAAFLVAAAAVAQPIAAPPLQAPALQDLADAPAPQPAGELGAAAPEPLAADSLAPAAVTIDRWLAIAPLGRYGRGPLHVDPLQTALNRRPDWVPQAGERMQDAAGAECIWTPLESAGDGWLSTAEYRGGYVAAVVTWPRDEVALLQATGHAMAYVNGVPRAGDPYLTGRTLLPTPLRAGVNCLIFHVAADRLRATLSPPRGPALLDLRDAALPDLVRGEAGPRFAAAQVLNAGLEPLRGAQLTVIRAGERPVTVVVGPVPACGVRAVTIPIEAAVSDAERQADAVRVQIDLTLPNGEADRLLADSAAFDLALVDPGERQVRTFLSQVDGSVQRYVLLPAESAAPGGASAPASSAVPALAQDAAGAPGLLVCLHDDADDVAALLAAARPVKWAHVIAPTGRRLRGCDWEDLSRRDVLEAIDDLQRRLSIDADRICLAGIGSGGHGVWRLAALRPDRFAAVAATGGWLDYGTYGGSLPAWSEPNPVERLLERCVQSTSLAPLLENLAYAGMYCQQRLTGPPALLEEARRMRAALAQFHGDFAYRELFDEPDFAYEGSLAGGDEARAFLERRRRPPAESFDHVRLAVTWLGEGSTNRWLEILQQRRQGAPSRAEFGCLAERRQVLGLTDNVDACAIDVSLLSPGEPVQFVLDGQALEPVPWPESADKRVVLERRGEFWRTREPLTTREKSPLRAGGFRSVFDRRVALVYGTRGDAQENAWAVRKARFDAENFFVRARGVADVVPDVEFQPGAEPDRNVLLYGNADTNAAWPPLLSTCPVQIRRGLIRVGMRPEAGDELACLLVYPRPGSETAVVGVVGGSGIAGMQATDRLPYFVHGVVLPDCLLMGADALVRGTAEVRAAGFFSRDWSLEEADIVWRDAAL